MILFIIFFTRDISLDLQINNFGTFSKIENLPDLLFNLNGFVRHICARFYYRRWLTFVYRRKALTRYIQASMT